MLLLNTESLLCTYLCTCTRMHGQQDKDARWLRARKTRRMKEREKMVLFHDKSVNEGHRCAQHRGVNGHSHLLGMGM